MAQTGYTPISIYYSATSTNVPTAGNLVAGELAINTADGKLFYKDSAGVVQVIAGKGGSGVAGGSNTQVQYNSSGSLAGSANFIWDNTNSRIGLGTASPAATLSISTQTTLLSGTGNGYGMYLYPTSSGATYIDALNGTSANASLNLRTYNNGTYTTFIGNAAGNTTTLATAGTERMRIDSSGNVAVGTTTMTYGLFGVYGGTGIGVSSDSIGNLSPANTQLSLQKSFNSGESAIISSGMGGLNYLNFYTSNAGAATVKMTISGTGNVGIGTSSPNVKLDVNGITGWSGSTTGIVSSITGVNAATGNGGNLRILTSTSAADNVGGSITLGGYFATTTNSVDFAEISGRKQSGQTTGGYMVLATRTDLGNITERMRIDSSGNVGIGTSSPPVASGYTSLAINNATNGGFLDLQKAGTAYVRLEIDSSNNALIGTGSGTTNAIRLQTNNTERMRIAAEGYTNFIANTTNGPYIKAGSSNSVANNGTISITSGTAGGAIVCIYDVGSGLGGVFWVNYSSAVIKIAGDGEVTDTGSSFAVYKSVNSHTSTFKNRNGGTATYTIAVYSAYASN
jgi:hypothetical protein